MQNHADLVGRKLSWNVVGTLILSLQPLLLYQLHYHLLQAVFLQMAPSQKSLNRNGAVESTQKAKHFCLLEESVLFGPELVVEKFGV